jgi:integrase/recombinase XerD
MDSPRAPLPAASRSLINRFIDALWVEDGLARLTLDAYRRDLTLYAQWLGDSEGRAIDTSSEADLLGYGPRPRSRPCWPRPMWTHPSACATAPCWS